MNSITLGRLQGFAFRATKALSHQASTSDANLHVPKRFLEFKLIGSLSMSQQVRVFSKMASSSSPQSNPDLQLKSKLNQHQECDTSVNLPSSPYVDPQISYAYGKSQRELRYATLAPLIETRCRSEPDSTALVVYDEGICKSFEQLNADINRLVNGLVEKLDLRVGDSVGVYSYNNYKSLVVHYACNKLGLVVNPFNPSFKVNELSHVLEKSKLKVLFMAGKNSRQSLLNDHWSVICDQEMGALQAKGHLSSLKDIVLMDGELEERELAMKDVKVSRWRYIFSNNQDLSQEAKKRINEVSSDDLYCVYYTSGTTGFPKGAAISQFNAINNATLSVSRLFKERGPKLRSIRPNICLPLPLFHAFAGILGILTPFTYGGSYVFPGMRYNIQSVVESILRFKCNAIYLTPTILIDMLGYIEQNGITKFSLQQILVAGSPVMPEIVERCYKVLPDLEEVRIAYGSSENGVIATIQTSQEPEDTKYLTVGTPLDLTEIRIVDTDTGLATMLGQSGEVQTRGFNTMTGYINDPNRTKEVITQAKWYKTGDLGIIDKQGRLQIVGRIKDLIIKGGENIYPAEIEKIIHKHPDVEDAHVFGIPDKRFGEEVCVWVKLKEASRKKPEDEMRGNIIDFCKDSLTYFKVPKHVIFVTEFPTTPVKKIKKFDMRAKTMELLGITKDT